MFSILDQGTQLCDGITRREVLRVGGLTTLGLSLPKLIQAGDQPLPPEVLNDPTFGKAKNIIYLWLQGGPPQHETFDPKPNAPVEIRGPFNPIQTNVVGTQFCELLPRTARIADKLAVVRSLSTNNNIHSSSGFHVLTGYKYVGPNARTISSTDWPWFGSIIKMMKPSKDMPPLSTAWLPRKMHLNEGVTPAGQSAGFLGRQWDPDRFEGDPSDPNFHVEGLDLSDIPPMRLRRRMSLLQQVEDHFRTFERGKAVGAYNSFQDQAFDLLTTGKVQDAFAIGNEPDKVRDAYGRHKWGQTVLLARRLIEVGARLVHVNWCREPGDSAVDNPMWDTHAQNPDRLEDVLCPMFDVGFTALIEDLDQRGLLDETLVVAIAEFGRTPKINAKAGRDHWGSVFSFAMAGAGINGGQVFGESDKNGAYPAKDKVSPGEVTATIFHLLGIPHTAKFKDPQRQEHAITEGSPLRAILGTETGGPQLTKPGGSIARVPPFDSSLLLNTDFTADVPLRPTDFGSRPKGWRGWPLLDETSSDGLGVRLIPAENASGKASQRHVALGFGLAGGKTAQKIPAGSQIILAQEMRNPRLGQFTFSVEACGHALSKAYYEDVFLKNFTCRLVIFRYNDPSKNPLKRQDFISVPFVPPFAEISAPKLQRFEVAKRLGSSKPGSNFPIGNGYGVAIIVEKTSTGLLELPAEKIPQQAFLRIDSVQLEFTSRTINEKVKV